MKRKTEWRDDRSRFGFRKCCGGGEGWMWRNAGGGGRGLAWVAALLSLFVKTIKPFFFPVQNSFFCVFCGKSGRSSAPQHRRRLDEFEICVPVRRWRSQEHSRVLNETPDHPVHCGRSDATFCRRELFSRRVAVSGASFVFFCFFLIIIILVRSLSYKCFVIFNLSCFLGNRLRGFQRRLRLLMRRRGGGGARTTI